MESNAMGVSPNHVPKGPLTGQELYDIARRDYGTGFVAPPQLTADLVALLSEVHRQQAEIFELKSKL